MAATAALIVVAAGLFSSFRDGPPPGLPPMLRYEPPEFPPELRGATILDGDATVAFTVDADGDVLDIVAVAASHPAFAAALENAARSWRLKPQQSPTTPRREVVRFIFRRTGKVHSLSHLEAAEAAFPGTVDTAYQWKTVLWAQLVEKPVRVAGGAPVYPPALKRDGIVGHVTVSYVIDREGKVCIPVVLTAAHEELGLAAAEAVAQWRFTPPRHEGTPVLVQHSATFQFGGLRSQP